MPLIPEGERSSEEIAKFHHALIKILTEVAHIHHGGLEDEAIFVRPFSEWTGHGIRPTGFGIAAKFPCITDHETRVIPKNSKVQLGFITDPVHLAIEERSAILAGPNDNFVRNADYKVLRYFNDCVKAAIAKPTGPTDKFPFSDS